jgi:hypothetical protein
MARGRNQGTAAQPKARAVPKAAPAKTPVVKSSRGKPAPAAGAKKAKSGKPAPQPLDLRAALPYFLIRIAVFLVLTVVLIAIGFYVMWALLIGMAAAAIVTWPIARIQKRVSRREVDKAGNAAR